MTPATLIDLFISWFSHYLSFWIFYNQSFHTYDLDLEGGPAALLVSVAVYGWDARGIGHADGLDWAPNSVGAR